MEPRIAGATRQWQPAIAIVIALSVFVALIVGSSLRPPSAASAPPEPAAWTLAARASSRMPAMPNFALPRALFTWLHAG